MNKDPYFSERDESGIGAALAFVDVILNAALADTEAAIKMAYDGVRRAEILSQIGIIEP